MPELLGFEFVKPTETGFGQLAAVNLSYGRTVGKPELVDLSPSANNLTSYCIFYPNPYASFTRILRKSDLLSLYYYSRINTMYKRKADKVRPVDIDYSDSSKPEGILD